MICKKGTTLSLKSLKALDVRAVVILVRHDHDGPVAEALGVGVLLGRVQRHDPQHLLDLLVVLGQHYLSNATCLIRPPLCYVCFVVSRSTIHCCIIRLV